jgi:pantothenate kinase, type III
MLLTLDIGNTEITVGLFRGADLDAHWRLTTNPGRTPDEWGSAIGGFLLGAGHSPNEVRAVCLASVAPSVTQAVVEGIARTTGCTGVQVDARSPLPVTLDVDEPLSVGADRIVNALAAVELYHRDTIVVDFGTATTFDCVTAGGAVHRRGHHAGTPHRGRPAHPPNGQAAGDRAPGTRPGDRTAHRGVHSGRRPLRDGRRGGRTGAPDPRRVARRPAAARGGDRRPRQRGRAAHDEHRGHRSRPDAARPPLRGLASRLEW